MNKLLSSSTFRSLVKSFCLNIINIQTTHPLSDSYTCITLQNKEVILKDSIFSKIKYLTKIVKKISEI